MALENARVSTLAAALLCLVVAGCNSTQTRSVQTGSGSQIGKPVATLITRLGEPTSESRSDGQTVYSWRSDRQYVQGGMQFVGSSSVYGSTVCTLRVYADADGVIQSWDLDDESTTSRQTCDRFVQAMQ